MRSRLGRLRGALALLIFTACQFTPSIKPGFPVSQDFEGQWEGERIDVSGDGICRPTKMSGSVTKGEARLRLHYNGTLLTGWISQDGSLVLNGDNSRWDYRFSGKATGDEIRGIWSVGNAPCQGTWYVKRR